MGPVSLEARKSFSGPSPDASLLGHEDVPVPSSGSRKAFRRAFTEAPQSTQSVGLASLQHEPSPRETEALSSPLVFQGKELPELTKEKTGRAIFGGHNRPKWRLCFRVDRQPTKETNWRCEHDFFITVVDPPSPGDWKIDPPAPFFASRMACHIADLIASRPMLANIPGNTFEGKAVAVIGHECLTAGLVTVMLGAKVVVVSERSLLSHVQFNLRLFRKDTLDYTKTKNATIACVGCGVGRTSLMTAANLCDQISAPALDLIFLSESGLREVSGCTGSLMDLRRVDSERMATKDSFWDLLRTCAPPKSTTRILLVCDESASQLCKDQEPFGCSATGLPSGLNLPQEWQARPFCILPRQIPVIWLERLDAEVYRGLRAKKAPIPLRKSMPPMGSTSIRYNLGSERRPEEWIQRHKKLKESLIDHNLWKGTEAESMIEQARSYSRSHISSVQSLTGMSSTLGSFELLPSVLQEDHFPMPPTHGQCASIQREDKLVKMEAVYCSSKGQLNHCSFSRSDGFGGCSLPSAYSSKSFRSTQSSSNGWRKSGASTHRAVALPKASSTRGTAYSEGSRSARGPCIADRHEDPPYWYRCNRAIYGSNRSTDASVTI